METKVEYTEEIPDFGDVMTVEHFRASCKAGAFIDYDGFGNPAKDGKVAGRLEIQPSRLHEIPEDATHIVWFNR